MSCLPHMKLIFFKPRANDYIVPPKHTQDWGYRLLESTNKTLFAPRTQEKEAMTPQETEPDLPENVQESPVKAWVNCGLLGSQRH